MKTAVWLEDYDELSNAYTKEEFEEWVENSTWNGVFIGTNETLKQVDRAVDTVDDKMSGAYSILDDLPVIE